MDEFYVTNAAVKLKIGLDETFQDWIRQNIAKLSGKFSVREVSELFKLCPVFIFKSQMNWQSDIMSKAETASKQPFLNYVFGNDGDEEINNYG